MIDNYRSTHFRCIWLIDQWQLAQELLEVWCTGNESLDACANQLYRQIDADKSGEISSQEWNNFLITLKDRLGHEKVRTLA